VKARLLAGRRRSALGALASLVILLGCVACGDDGDTGAGGTTATPSTGAEGSPSAGGTDDAAPSDVDRDGVLRFVTAPSSGGHQLDPADTSINSDEAWLFMIYGTPLREAASGALEPWLAESVEVVDGSTVKLRLREGVTFSDGTPYDAAALRRGMLRNLNEPGSPIVHAQRNFAFRELEEIRVDGPLELTFLLKSAVAGEFLSVLAGREATVPSPASLDAGVDPSTEPVGAGPYVLAEHRPEQLLSLRRNESFIDANRWPLGGIDWVYAAPGAPTVNAILGGHADAGPIAYADAATFRGNGAHEVVLVHRDFDYYVFNFCRTKPPFDDINVRRALQMALDREAINAGLIGGEGEVAYGFWPEGHRYFDDDLRRYAERDVEEAKRLLAAAGASNLEFDLVQPVAAGGQVTRLSEIVQGQLAEVGVTANLLFLPTFVADFITPQRPGVLMNPGSRTGTDRVATLFRAGSIQALCGSSDEQIMGWANEIAAMSPDDPRVPELWAQIEQRNAEQAFVLFLVKVPTAYTFDTDRVGGTPQFSGQRGTILFESVYIRA